MGSVSLEILMGSKAAFAGIALVERGQGMLASKQANIPYGV
jgi:hypothetical protein